MFWKRTIAICKLTDEVQSRMLDFAGWGGGLELWKLLDVIHMQRSCETNE